MKFFTKEETKAIAIILFSVIFISLLNFRVSLRRARDNQRKNDIRQISQALEYFNRDFGFLPLSSTDGRIRACIGPGQKLIESAIIPITEQFIECDWGIDALRDVSDQNYPSYLEKLPVDPRNSSGVHYIYISDTKRFQLLAYLEGKKEAENDPKIAARKIKCGKKICNFGLGYGNTPLDKSLEEYENELLEKERK